MIWLFYCRIHGFPMAWWVGLDHHPLAGAIDPKELAGYINSQCWSQQFSPVIPSWCFIYFSSGWWFGCHEFYFPINIGFLIIPIDELIFFRGVAQPPTSIYMNQYSSIINQKGPWVSHLISNSMMQIYPASNGRYPKRRTSVRMTSSMDVEQT